MRAWLREPGRRARCRSLIACITAENEESCRFHERLGFERVSLFREVGVKFGKWLDVADYQMRLLS
ncbi:MAG: GNAT family N-acetyltransferase [Muribaculaceae bacterium]|nr:GNAT family N-acetyltransferase [Muribaculaceae bacterium]